MLELLGLIQTSLHAIAWRQQTSRHNSVTNCNWVKKPYSIATQAYHLTVQFTR